MKRFTWLALVATLLAVTEMPSRAQQSMSRERKWFIEDSIREAREEQMIQLDSLRFGEVFSGEEKWLTPDEYAKCPFNFYCWAKNNLKYSSDCREWGVEGRVEASFVINKDGSIFDVKILNDPDLYLGKEVERVLREQTFWKPAKCDGKPFRQRIFVSVNFTLGLRVAMPSEVWEYIRENKFKEAASLLLDAARYRNGDAIYLLSQCYEEGEGVPQDPDMAEYWREEDKKYKHSMELESTPPYIYGKIHIEAGENPTKEFKQQLKLAKKKDAKGSEQTMAGLMYEIGYGTPKNCKKAAYWYQKGVDNNDSEACRWLASCYESGCGVETNPEEAFRLYRKYCDIEKIETWQEEDFYKNREENKRKWMTASKICTRISGCYRNGIGTEKSPLRAAYWHHLAFQLYLWNPDF